MTQTSVPGTATGNARKTNIIYWILTGLFAFVMIGSGIPDIMVVPMAVQGFHEIGFPAYLIPFLGWAKLLGGLAILVPGFPRLKEWAYAGLLYDLLGATYSVANSGKTIGNWAPMLVFVALGLASYAYYHKRQTQQKTLTANRNAPFVATPSSIPY